MKRKEYMEEMKRLDDELCRSRLATGNSPESERLRKELADLLSTEPESDYAN